MDIYNLLILSVSFHLILFCLKFLVQGGDNPKRKTWYQRWNISIGFLQVKWWTSSWNRLLHRVGNWRSSFWDLWFSIGTWLTLLLMLPAVLLLVHTLISSVSSFFGGEVRNEAVLQPVLPGVNLPSSEFIHYVLTLLICSIIHEAGHAIAAVRQNVPLVGVGVILFFIMPAAYVDLPTREVEALTPRQQLSVYCGGVWHNVALASFSYLLLVSIPYLAVPFYSTGNGIHVLTVHEERTGLFAGDHVTQVDDCRVSDVYAWRACLVQILQEPPKGFCTKVDILQQTKAGSSSACCDDELQQSHLCFQFNQTSYSCSRARELIERSTTRCSSNSCGVDRVCALPVENDRSLNNITKLIQIKRTAFKDVLFYGHPADLYSSVRATSYVPRTFLSPAVVDFLESLLKYLVSFSAGLAVLNVVPSFALDGQHIVRALCQFVLSRSVNGKTRETIVYYVVLLGTILLAGNIFFGVYLLFV